MAKAQLETTTGRTHGVNACDYRHAYLPSRTRHHPIHKEFFGSANNPRTFAAETQSGNDILNCFWNTKQLLEKLEAGPELAIFHTRDHGSLLRITGQARQAVQYDIGNPLTASMMTRHQLAAGLYAPLRVVLYEDQDGGSVFEYDRPSSRSGQFGQQVNEIANGLDVALDRA